MQVKIIAECSKRSILQYFKPSLSYQLSLRPLFCLLLPFYTCFTIFVQYLGCFVAKQADLSEHAKKRIVSEYDQEIPQSKPKTNRKSHTTITRHQEDKTKQSNQLSLPHQDYCKVSKGAKIRNRYNHVPHLTQKTNGKVTNSQLYTTNASQEASPFPAGHHKAQINRCAQRHNKHKTEKTHKISTKEVPPWNIQ